MHMGLDALVRAVGWTAMNLRSRRLRLLHSAAVYDGHVHVAGVAVGQECMGGGGSVMLSDPSGRCAHALTPGGHESKRRSGKTLYPLPTGLVCLERRNMLKHRSRMPAGLWASQCDVRNAMHGGGIPETGPAHVGTEAAARCACGRTEACPVLRRECHAACVRGGDM